MIILKKDIDFWKEEIKTKSIEKIGEQEFEINTWGSCQYSGALAFFNTYFKMRKDLTKEEIFEVFNIQCSKNFSWKNFVSTSFEIFQLIAIKNLAKNIYEYNFDLKYIRHKIDELTKISLCKNFDEYFRVLQSCGYDLWTAVKNTFNLLFDNPLTNIPNAPGQGPILNIICQQQNYETGLCCALLIDLEIVKDFLSFANFST